MTLKKTPRWMQTALTGARDHAVAMPWTRGDRRAEMLARRKAEAQPVAVKRATMAAC